MASAQVGIVGSPEWQAYKNAELAHLAPSIGPSAAQGINHANELLAWEQANPVHTANALNFVASGAGRRKRQVQVMILFITGTSVAQSATSWDTGRAVPLIFPPGGKS